MGIAVAHSDIPHIARLIFGAANPYVNCTAIDGDAIGRAVKPYNALRKRLHRRWLDCEKKDWKR
jgi:hypothetical protein